MVKGNFVRGQVEDLLTLSQEDEAVWEEETSNAN